jgi:LPPG:FO 2-phospho-L-lactate transferase
MYAELGVSPSATAVAEHYQALLTGYIIDNLDEAEAPMIRRKGIETLVLDTLMRNQEDRRRLAEDTLTFAERIIHT